MLSYHNLENCKLITNIKKTSKSKPQQFSNLNHSLKNLLEQKRNQNYNKRLFRKIIEFLKRYLLL